MRLRGTPHLQHRVPLYSTEKTGYVAYLRGQLSCETCLTRHSLWQLVVQCNQIKRGVALDAAIFWQLIYLSQLHPPQIRALGQPYVTAGCSDLMAQFSNFKILNSCWPPDILFAKL